MTDCTCKTTATAEHIDDVILKVLRRAEDGLLEPADVLALTIARRLNRLSNEAFARALGGAAAWSWAATRT